MIAYHFLPTTGVIPAELTQLKGLIRINLGVNKLTGERQHGTDGICCNDEANVTLRILYRFGSDAPEFPSSPPLVCAFPRQGLSSAPVHT